MLAGRAVASVFEDIKVTGTVNSQSLYAGALVGNSANGSRFSNIKTTVDVRAGGVVSGFVGNNLSGTLYSNRINIQGGSVGYDNSHILTAHAFDQKLFGGFLAGNKQDARIVADEVSIRNRYEWDTIPDVADVRAGSLIAFAGAQMAAQTSPILRFDNVYSDMDVNAPAGGTAQQEYIGGYFGWFFDQMRATVVNSIAVSDMTQLTNPTGTIADWSGHYTGAPNIVFANSYVDSDTHRDDNQCGLICTFLNSASSTTATLQGSVALYSQWDEYVWDLSGVGSGSYPALGFQSHSDSPCDLPAAAPPYHRGTGTIDDPYVICNAAQFAAIDLNVSDHFVLGSDISLTGHTENIENSFTGSLDGKGYTISNFGNATPITNTGGLGSEYGLFNHIDGATIRNVHLKNFVVHTKGYQRVGCFIGYISNQAKLLNITAENFTCTGNRREVGGFAGSAYSAPVSYNTFKFITLKNIYVEGDQRAGGFIGNTDNALMSDIYAFNLNLKLKTDTQYGELGEQKNGGFIGRCETDGDIFENIYVQAFVDISEMDDEVGLFCGRHSDNSGTFQNIYIEGTLYGMAADMDKLGLFVGQSEANLAIDNVIVVGTQSYNQDISPTTN